MKFITKLTSRLDAIESALCVGLDSRYDFIPEKITHGRSVADAIFEFNRQIIEATHDLTIVYKMNLAFYAGFGEQGLQGLRLTTQFLRSNYPAIVTFADCKRSEMGASTEMVKREIFEDLMFDCVMVTPWFGRDTVDGYLDDERRGVAVYVHDSNPSAVEFQDLVIELPKECGGASNELSGPVRLYEYVAYRASRLWNTNGNLVLEAGLTYPETLPRIRAIAGEEMPLLIAGVGPQGGNVSDLKGVFGLNGRRLLVNSSRGIIFAGDKQESVGKNARSAALALNDSIQKVKG